MSALTYVTLPALLKSTWTLIASAFTLLVYILNVIVGFYYDVGIMFIHYKRFQPTIDIGWCAYLTMNFNLQASTVVAKQRFHSLGSKCRVHLFSTTFPCYIWM